MKKIFILFFILFTIYSFSEEPTAYFLKIDGAIGPITYHQVKKTLNLAEKEKAEFVIIYLDTPGGLLSSTRKIVQEILQSEVPVIGFVYPQGAQCASAGTFIGLACHILVMAPATNIGAAHPVTMIGGEKDKKMEEKIVNDTVSFIKSIAIKRNKNPFWAEKAVRKSISSTENEALKEKVIDFIAKNTEELIKKIDGKTVELETTSKTIKSKDVKLKEAGISLREKLLGIISDPNIAYILLIIGIWGIILEFSHPGTGIPGIVGTICLILSFFALQTIPINITGLILIILSLIFFIIEAITPGFGLFLISGIISLFLGSFMLIKPISEIKISTSIIISSCMTSVIFITFIIWYAWKTKRRKVLTGKEGIIGEIGKTVSDLSPEGTVFIHGEYWNAKTKSQPILKNKKVKVIDIENFTLIVEEIKE